MKEGTRGIQSVEVSGRILNALLKAGEPVMLKDIAAEADMKPAQCHAYLTSLKNVGLVHQDWATGHYLLGPMALRLGISRLHNDSTASRVIEELKTLTDELSVMSFIAVWGEFGPTIMHIYAGPTQAALNLRHGSVFSLTGTVTGLVFAAFYDQDKIHAKVQEEFSHEVLNLSSGEKLNETNFKKLVNKIRHQGYAVTHGKPIPDLNAISVPVFDEQGSFVFAATLTGMTDKLPIDIEAQALKQIRQISGSGYHSEGEK